LQRINEEANNEEDKELRKNNMKRFGFFRCKFCFNVVRVIVDLGMVVICDTSLELWWVADEVPNKRYSFCDYPLSSGKIGWGQTARVTQTRRILQALERVCPIPMAIGIFAC
jgi:hypothetical protein